MWMATAAAATTATAAAMATAAATPTATAAAMGMETAAMEVRMAPAQAKGMRQMQGLMLGRPLQPRLLWVLMLLLTLGASRRCAAWSSP
jgi:hypothetical protein